jgi:putative oxidoreductase
MLMTNRFVPLALTLLAPVIVAIVGFHAVLAQASAGIAVFVLLLELYLGYVYRAAFAPLASRAAAQG